MKKYLNKNTLRGVLALIIVAGLFVLASIVASRYENEIQLLVKNDGVLGMTAYVMITIIAIVVAPISTLPLMPLASMLWGWPLAGVLSIIGWTIGAQIAFSIARRFGKSFIEKIISVEKLKTIEERIPKRRLFWSVVFLRMTIPVDVLSYALGLFSQMKSSAYFFATLVGVTPFAFVFAYAGTIPIFYQIEALVVLSSVLLLWHVSRRR